jgi:chromate transporter
MSQESNSLPRPSSPKELFVAFTWLALQGFGGVLAVAQRVLCEQRRWLTREEFVEILAVGQVLPGPNVCNVALMVGDRFFGWRGAFAALAGMMAAPLVIVLVLTAVYAEYALHPAVAGALKGMGAVAAGLIVGTALKLAAALSVNPMGLPVCLTLAVLSFVGVALLRWPLVWVLLGLGAVACIYAWRRLQSHGWAAASVPNPRPRAGEGEGLPRTRSGGGGT